MRTIRFAAHAKLTSSITPCLCRIAAIEFSGYGRVKVRTSLVTKLDPPHKMAASPVNVDVSSQATVIVRLKVPRNARTISPTEIVSRIPVLLSKSIVTARRTSRCRIQKRTSDNRHYRCKYAKPANN